MAHMLDNVIFLPSEYLHFKYTELSIDGIQFIDNGSDFLVFLS